MHKTQFYFRIAVSLHSFPKKGIRAPWKNGQFQTVAENVQDKPGILKSFQNPWLYKKECYIHLNIYTYTHFYIFMYIYIYKIMSKDLEEI